MRNKIISMLLTAAMVTTMLAGCGQKPTTGSEVESGTQSTSEGKVQESVATSESVTTEKEKEEITLTVNAVSDNGTEEEWGEVLFEGIKEEFNIVMEPKMYSSEEWKTKFSLLLASDELPDIITGMTLTLGDAIQYGEDGYFLDLSDYMDIMPNFAAFLEEYPDYASSLKAEDGSIYALNKLNDGGNVGRFTQIFMNKAWLENVGKEVPVTLDELYDVLVAFKEQDANGNGDPNDEIPFGWGGSVWQHAEAPILWAHGIYSVMGTVALHIYADDDGNVIFGDTTENFKDFLKYMNKLYEAELVPANAYTITRDELEATRKEGKIGFMPSWYAPDSTTLEERLQNWMDVPGFTTEAYNNEQIIVGTNRIGTSYLLAVNANVEEPERVCEFIDWLFTDEGIMAAQWGYDGKSFDLATLGGVETCDIKPYQGEGTTADWRHKATAGGAFNIVSRDFGGSFDILPQLSDAVIEDPIKNGEEQLNKLVGTNYLRERMIRDLNPTFIDPYPTLYYTNEEATERATLRTDLQNYLVTAKAEFIPGEKDIDKDWDAYVAELNKIGLERLMEIEEAAYARYLEKAE